MIAVSLVAKQAASGELASRARQPVALGFADAGNTDSRRQSTQRHPFDHRRQGGRVAGEHEVGRGLADLAVLKGDRGLLAVDEASNELLLLEYHDRAVRVLDRLQREPDPARLALLTDDATCAVASLWSRRLTFVSIAKEPRAPKRHSLPSAISSCRFARARWPARAMAQDLSSPTRSAGVWR